MLTLRAIGWATDAPSHDDITFRHCLVISASLTHNLDRDQDQSEEQNRQGERRAEVKTLGVDEHIWRPSWVGHRPGRNAHGRSEPVTRTDAATLDSSPPSSAAPERPQVLAVELGRAVYRQRRAGRWIVLRLRERDPCRAV
jgi:hypothetical protein